MRARDVMTTDVVTVDLDTSVREIARLLLARRISAVPVVAADGRLAGIVSEGDLVRRPELGTEARPSWWLMLLAGSEDLAQSYRKAHGRRAADVMTHDVVTVAEDAPVSEIARLLEERRFSPGPCRVCARALRTTGATRALPGRDLAGYGLSGGAGLAVL